MNSFWHLVKESQLDVLKEIGNIGAGHAATSLSKLMDEPIDMPVPDVHIVSFQDITERFGDGDEVVVAIFLRIEGDLTGNMFFILQVDSARQLLSSILARKLTEGIPGNEAEFECSVLQEIGNVLSGSYLSAIADFTGLKVQPTVPMITTDMVSAVLSDGVMHYGHVGDDALVINTSILESEECGNVITGQFFLLPDPESLFILFNSLGVPLHE